jgi:anaerobic magnesium-protoporphyrin IX monomethyl ester cyclase
MLKMAVRILFVEPPKDYWFLMGEYLPPPTTLLSLAAYVEREVTDVDIEVLDCQAEGIGWKGLEKRISSYAPNIVASSGFTCNAYACARVAELAKTIDPGTVTVVGGQHFSFTAEESLHDFREIDYVVRGEGERTLVELVRTVANGMGLSTIDGLSFRAGGHIIHTPPRSLIEDLDSLPFPAYHLVEKNLNRYHFKMMAGKSRYLILEGSRGCWHQCSFCTQWCHWGGKWRTKSAERIANEMAHLRDDYGAEFVWFTDDNFELGKRGKDLAQELRSKDFNDSIPWFFQARMDDIVQNPDVVSRLHDAGNNWQLLGVESSSSQVLSDFKKNERVEDAARAVSILKSNGILVQAMFVTGSRRDTSTSIGELRDFVDGLDVDIAVYSILTPFPGTELYDQAKCQGWIEDANYAHYDMIHAIMPTEALSRMEVQEELLECYRLFYGSPLSILRGLFSSNELKKRGYRHLAGKRVLHSLRQLV